MQHKQCSSVRSWSDCILWKQKMRGRRQDPPLCAFFWSHEQQKVGSLGLAADRVETA